MPAEGLGLGAADRVLRRSCTLGRCWVAVTGADY